MKQAANKRTYRQLFWIVLLVVGMVMAMGAYRIVKLPGTLFEQTVRVAAPAATAAPTPLIDVDSFLPAAKAKTTPVPTMPPQEEAAEADPDPLGEDKPLSGIVNIALFGLDAYETGGTTSGTMVHTDVNMIVAINFDTDEVSLISVARDIFTDIPGHDGFYKLNCAFNVGGGLGDPKAGMDLACRELEQWLGGVSVPYYFGLDYKAAFDVVDAIGGIDFNTEIDLYDLDGTRIANAGQNHLNGRGVLAYLRMRKTAGGLDSLRTARQRKMMVAIFKKLKEAGQLSQIPDVLSAIGDDIYTNMTIPQITALVNYAANIDPDSIQTYSIQGDMVEQYLWRYCFVNQEDRINILRTVYGIEAAPMPVNSAAYERFLYDSGFMALQHIGYAKELFKWIHSNTTAEDMTDAQKKAYALCWREYMDLIAYFDQVDAWTKERFDQKKLSNPDQDLRTKQYQALGRLERALRTAADDLNKAFGNPVELNWTRNVNQWFSKESVINEVYVDFR